MSDDTLKQPEFVKSLPHGLYKIFFKEDAGYGFVLAAVGSTYSGRRWFAPTNWTTANEVKPLVASTDWSGVERVEKMITEKEKQQ